jgi:hypothetical protein
MMERIYPGAKGHCQILICQKIDGAFRRFVNVSFGKDELWWVLTSPDARHIKHLIIYWRSMGHKPRVIYAKLEGPSTQLSTRAGSSSYDPTFWALPEFLEAFLIVICHPRAPIFVQFSLPVPDHSFFDV